VSRSARENVAAFWDEHVRAWLDGDDPMRFPLDSWYSSYRGRDKGTVTRDGFVEPYQGHLAGDSAVPRVVLLALNPGRYFPDLQSRTGLFADEIRSMGSYSRWVVSHPYDRDPWLAAYGPNRFYRARLDFMRRWLEEPEATYDDMLMFELYPWHSTNVTASMKPPASVIDEFVWQPIAELPVDLIFAFGSPWTAVAEGLKLPEVVRLGAGGLDYGSAVATRAVRVHDLPSGQRLVIEWHSGSALPPSAVELHRLRHALARHLSSDTMTTRATFDTQPVATMADTVLNEANGRIAEAPTGQVRCTRRMPQRLRIAAEAQAGRGEQTNRWNRATWSRTLPEFRHVFDALPDTIRREDVRTLAQTVRSERDALDLFVAAMVWGHGTTGYGAWRTVRVMEQNPDAAEILLDVRNRVLSQGGAAAFRFLASHRLRYLGVAFATKYLYFCDSLEAREPALILDAVVQNWLRTHAQWLVSLDWSVEGYREYIACVQAWAAELGVAASTVELAMFQDQVGRRSQWYPDPEPRLDASAPTASSTEDVADVLEALTDLEDLMSQLPTLQQEDTLADLAQLMRSLRRIVRDQSPPEFRG
jgi:hypothetical protein